MTIHEQEQLLGFGIGPEAALSPGEARVLMHRERYLAMDDVPPFFHKVFDSTLLVLTPDLIQVINSGSGFPEADQGSRLYEADQINSAQIATSGLIFRTRYLWRP